MYRFCRVSYEPGAEFMQFDRFSELISIAANFFAVRSCTKEFSSPSHLGKLFRENSSWRVMMWRSCRKQRPASLLLLPFKFY